MADFDPPFGENAGFRRYPDEDEQDQGFLCGPSTRELFIGLFHRIEAELGEVITHGGLVPSNGDLTQVRKAIQAMIDASTGGGGSDFVLMSQARTRLPIHFECQAVGGVFSVAANGTGSIRLPAGSTFLHRGIQPHTTVQTDFATLASKIYHLRWYASGVGRAQPAGAYPDGRWYLEDLADAAVYNPGSVAETDERFDSTYDSLLAARIVTNSSNVATITNLINLSRLESEQQQTGAGSQITTGSPYDGVQYDATFTLNWARKPVTSLYGWAGHTGGALAHGFVNAITVTAKTRYAVSATVSTDFQNDQIAAPYGLLRLTATR